ANHPEVTELLKRQGFVADRRILTLMASSRETLHRHDGWEEFPDFVGQLGMRRRVLLDRGALAAAVPVNELVGQLLQQVLLLVLAGGIGPSATELPRSHWGPYRFVHCLVTSATFCA